MYASYAARLLGGGLSFKIMNGLKCFPPLPAGLAACFKCGPNACDACSFQTYFWFGLSWPGIAQDDSALANLLMAWYYSGCVFFCSFVHIRCSVSLCFSYPRSSVARWFVSNQQDAFHCTFQPLTCLFFKRILLSVDPKKQFFTQGKNLTHNSRT